MKAPSDPAVIASYDTSAVVKWDFPIFLLSNAMVIVICYSLSQSPQFRSFPIALWIVVLAISMGISWFNWLSAVRVLELTAGTLRWRSWLRSGEIPLADLTRIRPSPYKNAKSPTIISIEFARNRSIRVKVVSGLAEFTTALQAIMPQLEINIGEYVG